MGNERQPGDSARPRAVPARGRPRPARAGARALVALPNRDARRAAAPAPRARALDRGRGDAEPLAALPRGQVVSDALTIPPRRLPAGPVAVRVRRPPLGRALSRAAPALCARGRALRAAARADEQLGRRRAELGALPAARD
eukprot:2096586-Prymnesium_polylepis.1